VDLQNVTGDAEIFHLLLKNWRSPKTEVVYASVTPRAPPLGPAVSLAAGITGFQFGGRTGNRSPDGGPAAARVISVANTSGDEPTAGLATARQEVHDKAAWMPRSFLE